MKLTMVYPLIASIFFHTQQLITTANLQFYTNQLLNSLPRINGIR